jgi:hypothetical protein
MSRPIDDQRQSAILAWLDSFYPLGANLLRTALRLFHDEGFPGRCQLTAHALRELCNGLFGLTTKSGTTDYKGAIKALATAWSDYGLPILDPEIGLGNAGEPVGFGSLEIPLEVATCAARLVRIGNTLDSAKDRARKFLLAQQRPAQSATTNEPTVERWYNLTQYFHKQAHSREGDGTAGPDQEFSHNFELLLESLHSLAGAAGNLDELDAILNETNA